MRKRMPAARAVLFCVSAGRGGKLEQLFYQARPQDRGLGASKSENLTAERALAGRPEEFLKRALKRLYEKRNPAKRHGRDARGKGRGATPVLRRLCALAAVCMMAAVSFRAARAEGFDLPFVWNTSGYETPETLALLSGLIDIYLTDLRYMRAETARLYSGAADYPAVAKEALRHMVADTGPCAFDDAGILRRGTVVRILLLPGRLAEAKLALVHLNKHYRGKVWVSLMQQYTPMPGMPAPLDRRVTPEEYASLVRFAEELGLTDAYTQEREAATESFIPPFDETGVRKEHS